MDMLNSMEDSDIEPVNITNIEPLMFNSDLWPVQPGDYSIINPNGFLSILVLNDSQIIDRSYLSSLKNVSIIGNLTTENIGIEYVIKNLISNPFIRHLAIVGSEITGHYPGNAIIHLHQNGIDAKKKIIGAKGARPILKNVLSQEIKHFQKQISIHDFIHIMDKDTLNHEIDSLNSLISKTYEHGLHVNLMNAIEAEPAIRLQLDREGYFIIMVRKGNNNPLYVEHYKNNGRLLHIIVGKDAATICSTIINMKLVSRLDHAAYIGRELSKAECTLSTNSKYVQDGAQGELVGKKLKPIVMQPFKPVQADKFISCS